ncbi:hypothetical protein ACW2AE_00130 [Limosilactobacillus fermentum]
MNKRVSMLVACSIMLVSGLVIGWGLWQRHEIGQEQATQSKILKQKEASLATIKSSYNQTLLKEALQSGDGTVVQNAQVVATQTKFDQTVNKFFNVVFTFSNNKEYLARANKAKAYATDDVLKNQKLFNDGKDSTGHSYVDSADLSVSFDNASVANSVVANDGTMTGYVTVRYYAQTGDSTPGISTVAFLVTYNSKTNLLTKVTQLGSLSNESM